MKVILLISSENCESDFIAFPFTKINLAGINLKVQYC
jgi:hypothetical protein